ncbi:hypothetical protein BGI33_05885 [Snodgrassella alvi]|nr:hypothetical protein BGI33_05885 [Snodgrassella alvi]PIT18176.1 hypothetical protein BGI34_05550 [Snodgrassella alvi]
MGYGCIGMFISTTIKGVYPIYFTNLVYYGVSIWNAGCGWCYFRYFFLIHQISGLLMMWLFSLL